MMRVLTAILAHFSVLQITLNVVKGFSQTSTVATSSALLGTAKILLTRTQLAIMDDAYSLAPAETLKSNKRIMFIRHGRSYMNDYINGIHYGTPGFTDIFPDTSEYREKYHDSPLGPTGQDQVQDLSHKLQQLMMAQEGDSDAAVALDLIASDVGILEDMDLVVVSPLKRALQTMEIGLYPSIQSRQIPVVAVPQAAERLYMVSDIGKTRRELKGQYSNVDFDSAFPSNIGDDDLWHHLPTPEEEADYVEWRPHGEGQVYACQGEPEHRFAERMDELYAYLDSRSENTIAVVCHAGVILWFLGDVVDNCGVRVVDFETMTPQRAVEPPKEQAEKMK